MTESHEFERLLAALPHGEPFRFVSELTMIETMTRGAGVWVVSGDEGFFAGHFPGEPIVPGVLLTEALAQLCGLVAFAGQREAGIPSARARLAQMDVKIHSAIRPPARIELAATLTREMGSLLLFEVAATAGGAAAASGRIVLGRTP
ncbi:MAG: beta-hydroxyacyl-ACP dehydratase [Pyrinomonadaceae bacterium]|nr:beta-hydroxyacyl-ACP dehydratase [Phycisphaerales bacterium]